ncbi:hypothetical protein HKI87_19g88540 [Chloropicon roscoffensis]|uniref:Uncharacterized protein n=1 Tax=Chloropicon roscoffensis TaxID=1461544 RepID=A0AAX4PN39_9CHLO
MGPYYKEVDHVEYQCVGQAGQKQAISLEEGLRWEGLVQGRGTEARHGGGGGEYDDDEDDWRESLSDL